MTIKVGKVATDSSLSDLLTSSSSLELGNDPGGLHDLADGLGASTAGAVNNKLGQVGALNRDDLTSDARGGTVDENTIVIDDIDDDGKLILVLSVVYQDDAANLDKLGEHLYMKKNKRTPYC